MDRLIEILIELENFDSEPKIVAESAGCAKRLLQAGDVSEARIVLGSLLIVLGEVLYEGIDAVALELSELMADL